MAAPEESSRPADPRPATGDRRRSCVEEAAILVAADAGAAQRLRDRHRPRPDGFCGGCGIAQVRWPCVHIVIAERAARIA